MLDKKKFNMHIIYKKNVISFNNKINKRFILLNISFINYFHIYIHIYIIYIYILIFYSYVQHNYIIKYTFFSK